MTRAELRRELARRLMADHYIGQAVEFKPRGCHQSLNGVITKCTDATLTINCRARRLTFTVSPLRVTRTRFSAAAVPSAPAPTLYDAKARLTTLSSAGARSVKLTA